MILIESSVWILAEHNRIVIADQIPQEETIAVCPPVVLEVLRGTENSSRYAIARRVLMAAEMLDEPMPLQRFEEAAKIFLRCRDEGVTIRSSIDCLVAACALAHDAAVMHNDRDYEHIREVLGLRTIPVTPSSSAPRSR